MPLFEKDHEMNIIHGHARQGHRTPTYQTWYAMKQRCLNPKNSKYHLYGGRGITVCESWNTFVVFLNDMGERPAGCTIDRIDSDGNYEPSNCRWATITEQNQHLRPRKLYKFNGKTQTLGEWAKELGLSKSAICMRLKNGWTVEEALSTTKTRYWDKYTKVKQQNTDKLIVPMVGLILKEK